MQLQSLLRRNRTVRVCVAYSGGLDSTVLLDALTSLRSEFDSKSQLLITAMHVNHGISPNAEAWEAHCKEQCQARKVALTIQRVSVNRERASLEAEARKARYAAFASADVDYVLQAHHQDDQAETVLLNLLRGSGVLGAAGIPGKLGKIVRPLLACTRADLLDYAVKADLDWIEDESNASLQHRRNYLRHQVLPDLQREFPGAAKNLASAAGHFSQAQDLLEQLAVEDGAEQYPLPLGVLVQLRQHKGKARAMNVLAFHLRRQGVRLPSRLWLEEAFEQLTTVKPDGQVLLNAGEQVIRRYRGHLYTDRQGFAPVPAALPWQGEKELAWGDGAVQMLQTKGTGIALKALSQPCSFRRRLGGERIHLGGEYSKSVKDLLREAGLPPWKREEIPLFFHGEELVWVPAVGIAEKYRCKPEEDGISLEFACPSC